jgi:choline dehydrogenase-like flavoprotein
MQLDVCVVGAGTTGIFAANRLTKLGFRVVLLEQGYDFRTAPMPEPISQTQQQKSSRCISELAKYFADDHEGADGIEFRGFTWIRGRQVGGRAITWSGSAPRFQEFDFSDWPILLSELKNFYEDAEDAFEVFDVPFPNSSTPLAKELSRISKKIRLFTTHDEIQFQRQSPYLGDAQGTTVDELPIIKLLAEAENSGLLSLLDRHKVDSIETDVTGRVVRAVKGRNLKTGEKFNFETRSVLLCASTIATAEVLLRSKTFAHPDGVGNNTGHVGQNLRDHTPTVCLTGKIAVDGELPTDNDVVLFYLPAKSNMQYWFQGELSTLFFDKKPYCQLRLFGFGAISSSKLNCIKLNSKNKNNEKIIINFSDSKELFKVQEKILIEGRLILAGLGYEDIEISRKGQAGLAIHESGTAKMGACPENSVVDKNCQVWGVSNLFISDASVFPTSGSASPTLTVLAITSRVCLQIKNMLEKNLND